jgi:enoyl-CoA hydratase/carnithine racemase
MAKNVKPRDRGGYKEHPYVIPHMTLDEYGPKFKDFFTLKREKGILEAKFHTNGDSLVWSAQVHRALWQICTYVGQDMDNEIMIFGGTGKNWIAGQDETTTMKEEENRDWMIYDHMFYDGTNICEGFIFDLEIPTIGVINGPGFHTEMALFCDITLMADNAFIIDPHYEAGMVPGDGIQIAFRECMGLKRANYAMLMCEKLDAKKCLEYGMVNEILPPDKIYDRAWEIARKLMTKKRAMRRTTVQILRAPWKEALAKELRFAFGMEMMVTATDKPEHTNDAWNDLTDKQRKNMAKNAEKMEKKHRK